MLILLISISVLTIVIVSHATGYNQNLYMFQGKENLGSENLKSKQIHDTDGVPLNNADDSEDLELPDKVFTLTAPSDYVTFDLYLKGEYMYHIYIELVTPHNCSSMKITVWDTESRRFDIFESEMFHDPEFGRYFEIPFGATESGNHNITLTAESEDNFNLYIKITQGLKCLYDMLEIKDPILYKLRCFSDLTTYSRSIQLETDHMYTFCIARVSAISKKIINEEVRLDYTITDPEDNVFTIYDHDILANILEYNSFEFGTAMEGTYDIDITIYLSSVQYVNIALAVMEDYQISEISDVNETDSKSSESSGTNEIKLNDENIKLPQEWLIGSIIFVGSLIGSAFALLKHYRKESYIGLPLKQK